ncbi:MAG: PD-(D/E)XK nuclease family protein [Chthoniobacter sp.]|nr:PD-(D/E)XK nuclease family protein [Chthoniobacter sp.]
MLIGVLDLIQTGRIIDFKTSSTTPHAEKVAHTTAVQTSSYAVLYREAIAGLTKLADALKHAQRESKASDKDIQSVRQTLRSLQSVRI